jgi:hypothetical protein
MQRPQKKHKSSHPKLTLCPRVCWSNVISRIVNKITEELVQSIKSTSPCFNDRVPSCDVWRLHLPLKSEPLGAGDLWGPWCRCLFFYILWFYVCVLAPCARVSERNEVLGHWSLGLQLINLNKGISTKKAPRFFLSPLFFITILSWVSYFFWPILRPTYEGIGMYVI